MSTEVLTSPDQCNAAWLTSTLLSAGALTGGRVVALRRRVQDTTTSTVVRLTARYSSDARGERPRKLFLKIPSPNPRVSLPEDFQRGDVVFYRTITRLQRRLPVPRCYSCVIDETERFHLLLEDLSGAYAPVIPGSHTSAKRCGQMIECLADFHAAWWGRLDRLGLFGPLPMPGEPLRYGKSLEEHLPAFFRTLGLDLPSVTRRLYLRAAKLLGPAVAAIHRPENLTLVNGDCHPGTVLLERGGPGGRIVDWQFHHVGLWGQDLMHMLGMCWPSTRRKALETELLHRYHRRLKDRGIRGLDWDLCWRGYLMGVVDNLFMPMWQQTLNIPRSHWQPTIGRAVTAVEDLQCLDVLA